MSLLGDPESGATWTVDRAPMEGAVFHHYHDAIFILEQTDVVERVAFGGHQLGGHGGCDRTATQAGGEIKAVEVDYRKRHFSMLSTGHGQSATFRHRKSTVFPC